MKIKVFKKKLIVVSKPEGFCTNFCKKKNIFLYVKKIFNKIRLMNRIDKETSGLVYFSKNKKNVYLVRKTYRVLVFGKIKFNKIIIPIKKNKFYLKSFLVNFNLKGKLTFSFIKKIFYKRFFFSLIEIDIKSGYTHQIRYHLSIIGHPILGDRIYGNRLLNKLLNIKRMFLHSYIINFYNKKKKKKLVFISKLPNILNGCS
ncbi:pseudouridine synthase [Candidatus Vidania fulgoroideorum]